MLEIVHDAIDRMVMQSDLRDSYHGVHVVRFSNVTTPEKISTEIDYETVAKAKATEQSKGIDAEFYLQLSDNNHSEADLIDIFQKYLHNNNYSLGGTNLYSSKSFTESLKAAGMSTLALFFFLIAKIISMLCYVYNKNDLVDHRFIFLDFDECLNTQYHDCSDNAYCFNLRGTYTCSCREGFVDLSENPVYPGRICSAAQIGCEKCNYHGTCYSLINGNDADNDSFTTSNNQMCECFQWYTGANCQVNLKGKRKRFNQRISCIFKHHFSLQSCYLLF